MGKGYSAYFSARLDKLFIRLAKFISLLLGVRFPDESLLKRYMDGSYFSSDVTTPSAIRDLQELIPLCGSLPLYALQVCEMSEHDGRADDDGS